MKLTVTNYTNLGNQLVNLISRITDFLTIDKHKNLTGCYQRVTEKFDVVERREHIRNVFR